MRQRTPLTQGELEDFAAAVVQAAIDLGQLLGDALQRAPEGSHTELQQAQRSARQFYLAMQHLQRQVAQLPGGGPVQPPGHFH